MNTKATILAVGATAFVCGAVFCLAITSLAGHQASGPQRHWTSTQLADAGYATPEAGLKTLLWGISNADADTFLSSLSPDAADAVQKAWQGKLDSVLHTFKRGLGKTKGYQILGEQSSNDEITIDLLSTIYDGRTYDRKYTFKKVGGEWKCAHVAPLPEIDD
jgi:hypothetical protein